MTKGEYLKRAKSLYNSGEISGEVYDSMIMNADYFCDEDENLYQGLYQGGLPATYAELEYSDFDNPEAILGARFDDVNYLRYRER